MCNFCIGIRFDGMGKRSIAEEPAAGGRAGSRRF